MPRRNKNKASHYIPPKPPWSSPEGMITSNIKYKSIISTLEQGNNPRSPPQQSSYTTKQSGQPKSSWSKQKGKFNPINTLFSSHLDFRSWNYFVAAEERKRTNDY